MLNSSAEAAAGSSTGIGVFVGGTGVEVGVGGISTAVGEGINGTVAVAVAISDKGLRGVAVLVGVGVTFQRAAGPQAKIGAISSQSNNCR